MASSTFRSPADRTALLAAYDRRLRSVPVDYTRRFVPTPIGETHLLLAGPVEGPPLIILHGGNGRGLDMLLGWGALTRHHRCAFVDVPGEPNHSVDHRLDKGGDEPGRWMTGLLDGLGWSRVGLAALSGGGAIALRIAATAPERIERMALIAPEGLASGRIWVTLRRVVWPLLRARRRPTSSNVERLLSGLCSPPVSPAAVERMQLALRHTRGTGPGAPRLPIGALDGFAAPVLVIAGGRDILFPGRAVIAHARRAIPSLVDAMLVPDAAHIDARWFAGAPFDRMRAFLRSDQMG